jgi:3-hydroxyisobutyrate dehydrogenase-like beta-hydroxyacid dehydrogenase
MNNAIGFIGLGRMGVAICQKIIANNIAVYVHNRTKAKSAELVAKGAIWAPDLPSLARSASVVFVCTSGSEAVDLLYYTPGQGLLSCLNRGSIVLDLSTIAPETAVKLHSSFRRRELSYVECPVSGGIEGAESGTLSAIVSAQPETYKSIIKLLKLFCSDVTYVSEPGKAQRLKILNNLAESINLAGAIEVISLGKAQGLDLESMSRVFKSCRGRSAYMDVALKYALSNGDSSNVSLTVRCKDLALIKKLNINSAHYPFSMLAISTFHSIKDTYGGEEDQCKYFSVTTN